MRLARRRIQLSDGCDRTDPAGASEPAAAARATHVPDDVVDDFVETYVLWREECDRVRGAYARWARADASDRACAFAVYRAALDQEESAARCYWESSERVSAYSR